MFDTLILHFTYTKMTTYRSGPNGGLKKMKKNRSRRQKRRRRLRRRFVFIVLSY
jgi:hypothetical protein